MSKFATLHKSTKKGNEIDLSLPLEEFVSKEKVGNDTPQVVSNISYDNITAMTRRQDHAVLNQVLLNILSPELAMNEQQKRRLKEKLVKYITKTLTIQLVAIVIILVLTYINTCLKLPCIKELTTAEIEILFSFLKYYITAIIAELIAMLFFIVKYVFDKSIVDLTKEHFKL